MTEGDQLAVPGGPVRRTSLASWAVLPVAVSAVVLVAVLVWMNAAAGGGDDGGPAGPVSSVADRVWTGVPELPPGEELAESGPAVAWLERGTRFAVVTMGSSSCPPVATSLDRETDGHISLRLSPSPHDMCTADMAPTTHEFLMPSGVDQWPVRLRIVDVDSGTESVLTLD